MAEGGSTNATVKIKLGPKLKLLVFLLAVYAVQVCWVQAVDHRLLTPTEWFALWWNHIDAFVRWLNTQWRTRHQPAGALFVAALKLGRTP